jgi:hypothetical protein
MTTRAPRGWRRARWRRGEGLSPDRAGNGEGEGEGAAGMAASQGGASSPVDGGGSGEFAEHQEREGGG